MVYKYTGFIMYTGKWFNYLFIWFGFYGTPKNISWWHPVLMWGEQCPGETDDNLQVDNWPWDDVRILVRKDLWLWMKVDLTYIVSQLPVLFHHRWRQHWWWRHASAAKWHFLSYITHLCQHPVHLDALQGWVTSTPWNHSAAPSHWPSGDGWQTTHLPKQL